LYSESLLASGFTFDKTLTKLDKEGCFRRDRNESTILSSTQRFDDVKKRVVIPFINAILDQFAIIETLPLRPKSNRNLPSSAHSGADAIHSPMARMTLVQFYGGKMKINGSARAE
jgi:hypothetical protein